MVLRIGLVGFVMNGLQFGAMYLAFDAGLGATLGVLMHSLSPVLTALLAALLLRERLSRTQVVGFVVGVAGVLLVLGPDVDEAGGLVGLTFGVVGTLALSFGTLGQRWIGRAPDPLWSAAIQFAASAPPLWVLGLALEGTDVVDDPGAPPSRWSTWRWSTRSSGCSCSARSCGPAGRGPPPASSSSCRRSPR